MSLAECPKCGFKRLADSTERCPYCGYSIKETDEKETRTSNQNIDDTNTEKQSVQQMNQYYSDVHQIAGDVRFIKNVIIAGIVIAVIIGIISIILSINSFSHF
ncbi:MAG: hypothetical protein IJG06_08255 [Clostridia bacterium]|nr:hypothetical protein [Clostridia bacterium]